MGGVVREVEPTLDRYVGVLGIPEAGLAEPHEPLELRACGYFLFELVNPEKTVKTARG